MHNLRPILFCFLLLFCICGAFASYPAAPSLSIQSKKNNSQLKSSFRPEQKVKIGAIRKLIRKQVEEEKTELALLLILAVLLPPLAVFLKEGQINSRFWISLLLTLLFWLPGVIYTMLVILSPQQA
jgi:uncharacterized membrane protein YqaE (UPF0057 family)